MYPKQQVFFVLGLSRSGCAAAQFLLSQEATVYIYDDVDAGVVKINRETLCSMGAKWVEKENVFSMTEVCDALVLSPGVAIDHPIAIAFRRNKKAVLGESELAARYLKALTVAVTGTNGKTTTVSMIEKVLLAAGKNAIACGNIGTPMISLMDASLEVAVAEISSFQLETLNSFAPHIAVLLNVTQDHLNRHYNMENYVFLKAKLLKNLTETEFAVLNYDDEIVREFSEKTKAQVVYFSVKTKTNGGYLEEGSLCYKGEKILSADEMLTGGMHNIQNALATICVGKLLGVDNDVLAKTIQSFKGVRHRVEEVATVDGVKYVNDSKGTNVGATLKAVAYMQEETLLLLGGKDKNQDYDELFATLKNSKVRHTILYGENRFRLIESAEKNGWTNVTLCTGFDCAVRLARMLSKTGQTVLLSPASASFDEFVDYEERGNRFVEIVEQFKKEKCAERKESTYSCEYDCLDEKLGEEEKE